MRERGLSLVELLAAVAILALAIVPLSAAFTQAYSAAVEEKQRMQALQFARAAMEKARNKLHAGNTDLSTIENSVIPGPYKNDYNIELTAEPEDQSSSLYRVTVTVSFLDKTAPRHAVTLESLVRKP